MITKKINIAIVGFGNIGSFFYKTLEKNNIWKDEKKLPKKEVSKTKNKETAINIDMASTNISSAKFKELAERITLKNKFRPFPNINDIPN